MKYSQRSFSVHAPGSKEYADNWERTFRSDSDEEKTPVGYPEPTAEVLQEIAELRRIGDAKWAVGKKESSTWYHNQASDLGAKFGLNVERCKTCGVHFEARALLTHGCKQ